jgi:hypothetical protein
VSLEQPVVGRSGVRVSGGRAEPVVPADRLIAALAGEIEPYRALLPVGYEAGVQAYQRVAQALTARDLSEHYTRGLDWFYESFVPTLMQRLQELSGGVWNLRGWHAYAAGSDVDLITHVVDGVASRGPVVLYPGDWHGFRVGAIHRHAIRWDNERGGALACLCVPSVRNGHLDEEMISFLLRSDAALLNLNLWPTLTASERARTAAGLLPVLPRSLLSISFSRGFGLTASQLGVLLVPPDHPLGAKFDEHWRWLTYFYNALAARAFLEVDPGRLQQVDDARRTWVNTWLAKRELPVVPSGSYYVKSFRVQGAIPEVLRPLVRDDIVRLCLKPHHLV